MEQFSIPSAAVYHLPLLSSRARSAVFAAARRSFDSHDLPRIFPGEKREAVDTFPVPGGKSKADNSRSGTLSRGGEEEEQPPKSLFYSRFTDRGRGAARES